DQDCSRVRRDRGGSPAPSYMRRQRRGSRPELGPDEPQPGAIETVRLDRVAPEPAGKPLTQCSAGFALPIQLQPELNVARWECGGNLPKRGISKDGIRCIEVRAIERVEHFSPELQPQEFAPVEPLLNSDVESL